MMMVPGRRRLISVLLNYQKRPPVGKRTGRNIGEHGGMAADLVDEHDATRVEMGDAHPLNASLGLHGFALETHVPPASFDDGAAAGESYAVVRSLVRAATGATRVVVFDHTLRQSGAEGLNALAGAHRPAAVVHRVHADYAPASAPARLERLAVDGTVENLSRVRRWELINVWRSMDRSAPVLRHPLAVCVPTSVDHQRDTWPYVMFFPDRVGANLSLDASHAGEHQWVYYPRMRAEDSLLFLASDGGDDRRRPVVFHTSFDDPTTPPDAPPRRSVEFRTVALWEDAD